MRIVVVGAGIIGTNIAYALARDGAEVTLIEQGIPGAGASHTSYAWLNSNSFDDPRYHALRVLGMAAYKDLAREVGNGSPRDATGTWLHETGSVHVAITESDAVKLRQRVAVKQAAGYPAQLVTEDPTALVPLLARLPQPPSAVAYYPAEGYVDTTTLIAALLLRYSGHGGTLEPARVTRLEDIEADKIVLATGADTILCRDAGLPLDGPGPAGATVITEPLPLPVNGLIHFPGLTIRPDGGGRVLLHSDETDARIDTGTAAPTLDRAAVTELTGRAGALLGLGDAVKAADVRVSFRPQPPDGFPVVGPIPGNEDAYVICTHSGVTLAAILARLTSREILTGTPEALLQPYRPERILRGG